jgi:outer membrane protein insertion porin family
MRKLIFIVAIFSTFLIAETEVTKISFNHNSEYDKDDLLDIIHSEEDEEFEPRLIKLDKILLNNFFRKNGYLLVNITDSLEFNRSRTQVKITYNIDSGIRYYYGGVVFNGVVEGDTSKLIAAFEEIKIGIPFDESLIINAARQVENVYYNSGKPFVNVKSDYIFEEDSLVIAQINIKENQTVYINDIKIFGLKIVQRFLIRRELEFKKGDLYNRRLIEKTQQNIYSTGLFKFVRMEIDPIPEEPSQAVLKIMVQEKDAKWIGFSLGVGHEQNRDNTTEFTLQGGHRNIFGTARSASLHLTPSFIYEFDEKQITNSQNQITFKFVEPWIGNTRTPGIFQLSYHQFREPRTAHFNVIQSSFEVHHKFENHIEVNGTLSAKFVDQLDSIGIDTKQYPELAGGKSTVYSLSTYGKRDTRTNLFNPENGSLMDLNIAFSRSLGEEKAAENRFITLISSWSRYQLWQPTIGRKKFKWVLASRLKAGSIFELGENKSIPVSEVFYAGGATTVRGYSERSLGPFSADSSGNIDALGGKLITLFNVEARIPLFWLFVGEVFFDAGNVWSEVMDFSYTDVRYTTGVGLAVITPLGPVRVDYGYKLNKRKIDKEPDAFHLGIYFAF